MSNLATVTEATPGLAEDPGHSVVLVGFYGYLEAQNRVSAVCSQDVMRMK